MLASGPFSPPKIRKLLPVFREKTNGLLEHLERMVQADESGTSCVVDRALRSLRSPKPWILLARSN